MKPELWKCLRTYDIKTFFSDLSAGVIVGIVALPLAIAFAIASGVEPERGLYTAVIAGFLISFLGGSRVQIGGPTGAFVVIVFGIVRDFGISGLMTATIMAGVMLLLLGAFRMGGLVRFIPYTIVIGFTAGIAVTILTTQIGDFFGLDAGKVPGDFYGKMRAYAAAAGTVNPQATVIALISLVFLILWPKVPVVSKKIPGSLLVILGATAAVLLLDLRVETIGSRYGAIPSGLPAPHFPEIDFATVRDLFPAAISIALLGAVESLLSAVVADGMIGSKHDPNTELIAQGVANIAAPLFGGIPATGAIARTATNVKNGGRTPVAGMVHAVVLLLILLLLGQYAVYIPLCALAAVLTMVSWNMLGLRAIKALLHGQKSDITVLAVTFFLTVFIDLTVAIEVGLVCAAFFFIRKMVSLSSVTESKNKSDTGAVVKGMQKLAESVVGQADAAADEEDKTVAELPQRALVFEVDGPLFFGTVMKFEQSLVRASVEYDALILRVGNMFYIDAGGIHVLEELFQSCCRKNAVLILSEIHTQPYLLLSKSGFMKTIGAENITGSFGGALKRCRELGIK